MALSRASIAAPLQAVRDRAAPTALFPARANRLVASLPDTECARWSRHLECVALPQGRTLSDSGRPASHAYFPVTAVVSLIAVCDDGYSPEIATVGNEGVVGIALFMGGDSMPGRAVVLSGGHGYQLPADILKETFHASPVVMRLLLRYTQALLTQMGRVGVCTRRHTVVEQLCRWLLAHLDRLSGNELALTQETIAHTIGVRREAVSEAALRLQDAGAIRYRRGHIQILDRGMLERHACECYAIVKGEYDRLLGPHACTSADRSRPPAALRIASRGLATASPK